MSCLHAGALYRAGGRGWSRARVAKANDGRAQGVWGTDLSSDALLALAGVVQLILQPRKFGLVRWGVAEGEKRAG